MSKRIDGEGTVRKHATRDLYEARYSYVDTETGLRRRGSVYGKTDVLALEALRDVHARLKAEKPPTDSKMTVAKWLDEWLVGSLQRSDRKPTTKETYRYLSNSHIRPAPFGALELAKVRPSHVDALIQKMRDNNLSESTTRNVYAVLNSLLDGARRDKLIAANPMLEVKRPTVAKHEAKFMEPWQVKELLTAAEGARYFPVLKLIAASGLRRGEALALEWTDILFDKQILKVRSTVSRVEGALVKTSPKTANSRREIVLSPGMVEMLHAHRKLQVAERLRAGNQWQGKNLVFATELGGYVDPRNLLRAFTSAAKAAGIPDVGLHTLRHSAASAMLDAGIPLHVVSRILGHGSISITADIYGHITDSRQREAMEGLSAALGF